MLQQKAKTLLGAFHAGQQGQRGAPRHEQVVPAEILVHAELSITVERAVIAGVRLKQAATPRGRQPGRDMLFVTNKILPRVHSQPAVRVAVGASLANVDEKVPDRLGERRAEL